MKLRSLNGNMELVDQFHDFYVRMLGEVYVERDREMIMTLKEILRRRVAFVMKELKRRRRNAEQKGLCNKRGMPVNSLAPLPGKPSGQPREDKIGYFL